MVRYKYDVHNVITNATWDLEEIPEVIARGTRGNYVTIRPNVFVNQTDGSITVMNTTQEISPTQAGDHFFNASGRTVVKRRYQVDNSWFDRNYWSEKTETKVRGSYRETISAEDGEYPNDGIKGSLWYVKQGLANSAPTVNITSPSSNQTLYENGTLSIAGTARDEDANQSVTVYYQINSETRKVLATDVSQKNIALSKQLTFKGGKLYDGVTAVTGALTDGIPHKLKVWAVDDQGGQSAIIERAFYVVPNRAPVLTVNTPNPSGIINADSFAISGTYSDADGNATTVKYRINGGNSVQVASGTGGSYDFNLSLGSLVVGDNTIVIDATDSYGAKTSKTIKFRKNEVKTNILRSTVRYKVDPPGGSASEMLAWVQHDAGLTVNALASMTLKNEAESYVAMSLEDSVTLTSGQVEDEFYLAVGSAKDSIILQLDLTKSNANTNEAITLITGVF